MRFDGFSAWKPTGKKHRYVLLIVTVGFAELGDKVFLLKNCSENDPKGPEHVEKQAVRAHVGGGPDENQHEKIEGMTDPEIRAAENEIRRPELPAAEMGLDGSQTECVKVLK